MQWLYHKCDYKRKPGKYRHLEYNSWTVSVIFIKEIALILYIKLYIKILWQESIWS